jgi:hypothetical protein
MINLQLFVASAETLEYDLHALGFRFDEHQIDSCHYDVMDIVRLEDGLELIF